MLFQVTEGALWSVQPAKWTGHPAGTPRIGLSPLKCVVIIRLAIKEGSAASKSKEGATSLNPNHYLLCYKAFICCGRQEPSGPETTLPGPQKVIPFCTRNIFLLYIFLEAKVTFTYFKLCTYPKGYARLTVSY